MSEFYVTLPSYTRPEFSENKANTFKVRLPNRLSLPGDGWKVGLASITFPCASLFEELTKANVDLVRYGFRSVNIDNSITRRTPESIAVTGWELRDEGIKLGTVYDGVTLMDWIRTNLLTKISPAIGLDNESKRTNFSLDGKQKGVNKRGNWDMKEVMLDWEKCSFI